VIRDNVSPDKILRFSHLYSRLLTEPVLQQKWATLYLLYLLADTEPIGALQEASSSFQPPLSTQAPPYAHEHPQYPTPAQREFVVDSPAFNDAFSQSGLPRLPPQDEPSSPTSQAPAPRIRETRERSKPDKTANPEPLPMPPPSPQHWISYANAQPSEPALLRDLPFVLQGLSSTNLLFKSVKTLQLPATLPVPIVGLLHSLAEPCLLYKSLAQFVESEGGGLVGQSFRSALGIELRSYLKLVATLEGQIRRALAQLNDAQDRNAIGQTGVTLKRCLYWTREATMGLRLMSLMVEESKCKSCPSLHTFF